MVWVKDYLECARRFVNTKSERYRAWLEDTPFEGCGCWEWEDSIYDAPQKLEERGLSYEVELSKYLEETEQVMEDAFPNWDANNPEIVEPLFSRCLWYVDLTPEQCFAARGPRKVQRARKRAMTLFFLLSRATLKEVASIFRRSLATVTDSIYSVISEDYWDGLGDDLEIVASWLDYETSGFSYYDKHADNLEMPSGAPIEIQKEWIDFEWRSESGEVMDPYTCGFCNTRRIRVTGEGPRSDWNNEMFCPFVCDWVGPYGHRYCSEFEPIPE